MLNVLKSLKLAAFVLLLTAQNASADLLFTNFVGDPFGGTLWTSGGPCEIASCYALADNFSSDAPWNVSGFSFYIVSSMNEAGVGSGVRYALFTVAGAQVVAPTSAAVTVTDTGLTYDNNTYKIYKLEISGLSIALPPGQYQFRVTNTIVQSVYPGYGNASAQTLSPDLIQRTGSQSVEALLSTDVSQREGNWAFQVHGTSDKVFADGFESQ